MLGYREGKEAFLRGEPLAPMPAKGLHSREQCDFRSGWRVAECNKRNHPDWADSKILA